MQPSFPLNAPNNEELYESNTPPPTPAPVSKMAQIFLTQSVDISSDTINDVTENQKNPAVISPPRKSKQDTPLCAQPSPQPLSSMSSSSASRSLNSIITSGKPPHHMHSGLAPIVKPPLNTTESPQHVSPSSRFRNLPATSADFTRAYAGGGGGSAASGVTTDAVSIFSCSLPGDVFEEMGSGADTTDFAPVSARFRAKVDSVSSTPHQTPRPNLPADHSRNISVNFETSQDGVARHLGSSLSGGLTFFEVPPVMQRHHSYAPNTNKMDSMADDAEGGGMGGILSFNPRPIQGSSSTISGGSKHSSNTSNIEEGKSASCPVLSESTRPRRLPPIQSNHSNSIQSSLRTGTSSGYATASAQLALQTMHDSLSDEEESGGSPMAHVMPTHRNLVDITSRSLSNSQGAASGSQTGLPFAALPVLCNAHAMYQQQGDQQGEPSEVSPGSPASATLDPRQHASPPMHEEHFDPEDGPQLESQSFSTYTTDVNPRLHEYSRYGIDEIIPGLLYLCAARALGDMSKASKLGISAYINAADEVNEQMLGVNNNFFTSTVSNSGSLGYAGNLMMNSSQGFASSVGHASSSRAGTVSVGKGFSTFGMTTLSSMNNSIFSSALSPSVTSTGLEEMGINFANTVTSSFQNANTSMCDYNLSVEGFASSRITSRLEAREEKEIHQATTSDAQPPAAARKKVDDQPHQPTTTSIPANLKKPTYTRSRQEVGGKIYLRLPMKDSTGEVLKYYIEENWNFIEMCRAANRKVVVFCKEGKSRSVALVTSYIMRRFKMSFSDALAYVRDRRLAADPNIGFCLQLQRDECFDWGDGLPMDHYDGSNPDYLFAALASTTMDPATLENMSRASPSRN